MISVITVSKNSELTVARTVASVASQRGVAVEHILKDGGSADNTIARALEANAQLKVCRIEDSGIYDAMNQGYLASSGEIVAFLNSDDYYSDDKVLRDVARAFEEHQCDFVYGDILMRSTQGRIQREWRTGDINGRGLRGRQIPHPGFFVRRAALERLEVPFDTSYRISADLKQQLILVNHLKATGHNLKRVVAVMELGGASTGSPAGYFRGWTESVRAYSEVQGSGALMFVALKVLRKLSGLRFRINANEGMRH